MFLPRSSELCSAEVRSFRPACPDYGQRSAVRLPPPNDKREGIHPQGCPLSVLSAPLAGGAVVLMYYLCRLYPRKEISTPAATAEPITPEMLLDMQ